MNDFVKFLIYFPAIMHVAGHLMFGPDWFIPKK